MGIRTSTLMHKGSKGSAIVLVLGITSLVVIMVMAMMKAVRFDIHRVERLQKNMQHQGLVLAAEAMAMNRLSELKAEPVVDLTQEWAQPIAFAVDKTNVIAHLIDLSGFFNVNTLYLRDLEGEYTPSAVFERLMAEVHMEEGAQILAAIEGSDERFHLISDIKAHTALSASDYAKLLTIAVVDEAESRAFNVNTLSSLHLAALLDLKESQVKAILEGRPYENASQLMSKLQMLEMEFSKPGDVKELFRFDSDLFLLHTEIRDKKIYHSYSVFRRADGQWTLLFRSNGVRA